jgi:hypothetical protein
MLSRCKLSEETGGMGSHIEEARETTETRGWRDAIVRSNRECTSHENAMVVRVVCCTHQGPVLNSTKYVGSLQLSVAVHLAD